LQRLGISVVLAALVALTVVLGASTVYLLAVPSVQNHTITTTFVSVSTSTHTATSSATLTTTAFSISFTTGSSGYTVGIAYKEGIGFYLVDGSGMTLYFRTTDDPQTGTSTCTGICASIWPPFYVQSFVLPPGLNASSFSTVTRADGTMQITYNGWPLYRYSGDTSPGDTNGQGIGGIWFAYTLPAPAQITSTISLTTSSLTSPTTSTAVSTATATSTSTTTIVTTTTSSSTTSSSTTSTLTSSTTMRTTTSSTTTYSYY